MGKSSSKSKSINNMKKIKGSFEKYNLFEKMDLTDNCLDEDVGPGIFCWIYIFWVIIVNITSLFAMKKYKESGLTDLQIMVRYLFQFLFMFLSVTFMFSMCKRCRGLEGLLILIILSLISGLITIGPFLKAQQSGVVEGQEDNKCNLKSN